MMPDNTPGTYRKRRAATALSLLASLAAAALLATGATASNLSNGNALAGRAAILVLQQLYHKVFKAKAPAGDNESFVSRFKVDVGGVDPRTGQQEISSRFKLSEDFYLVGDLDVGGDIRGTVRYLLHFK